MPLEPPDRQHSEAALGYCELGMFEDANAELEEIDPLNRATPEVLAVRVAIYHGLKKWDALQVVAAQSPNMSRPTCNGPFPWPMRLGVWFQSAPPKTFYWQRNRAFPMKR
jgi:hypothetical protein